VTTVSDASSGVSEVPADVSTVARARGVAWRIIRGTTVSAFNYRITGLAAEAAFFTLLSLPPLVLGLIGTIGHFRALFGTGTVTEIREWVIERSETVLTDQSVQSVVVPLLDDVLKGGRVELVSLSFIMSLWAGSRALNVYVDTITIAYGLSGVRGVIRTRLRAFVLYLGGLGVGLVIIPVLVAGPTLVLHWLPEGARVLHLLYWPVLVVVAVLFLTLLYHLSVPARTAWSRGVPGATVALGIWVLGSLFLRLYLDGSASGVTVYGSLGAAIAVLAWLYVTALAVLIGAALNAEIDKLWPGEHTARARAEAAEGQACAAKARVKAAEARVERVAAAAKEPPADEPTVGDPADDDHAGEPDHACAEEPGGGRAAEPDDKRADAPQGSAEHRRGVA
jgi:membrane protein